MSKVHNKYIKEEYIQLFGRWEAPTLEEFNSKYKEELKKQNLQYGDLIFDHHIDIEFKEYEWENGGEYFISLIIKRYETDKEYNQRVDTEQERQAAIDNKEYEQYLKLKNKFDGA